MTGAGVSTSGAGLLVGRETAAPHGSLAARARAYFAADSRRIAQTALGLFWLLDGCLQFQAFFYTKGFVSLLTGLTVGQPDWIASSMTWAAHLAGRDLAVYNTLFALVQVSIALGLLYRPTVRLALAVSFAWALVVWWFGEAFGMMFMTMASPLTGAPGAVLLYALIGMLVWPGSGPGGLLGVRGAKTAWCALWLIMAWLWLEVPSNSPGAITSALEQAPSGMVWLSSVQLDIAHAIRGAGVPIAFVLSALSAAIGVAVAANRWAKPLLILAVVLNLAYWVLGQGFGGIFQGGATDPNAGPLFVLLAYVMYKTLPHGAARGKSAGVEVMA